MMAKGWLIAPLVGGVTVFADAEGYVGQEAVQLFTVE